MSIVRCFLARSKFLAFSSRVLRLQSNLWQYKERRIYTRILKSIISVQSIVRLKVVSRTLGHMKKSSTRIQQVFRKYKARLIAKQEAFHLSKIHQSQVETNATIKIHLSVCKSWAILFVTRIRISCRRYKAATTIQCFFCQFQARQDKKSSQAQHCAVTIIQSKPRHYHHHLRHKLVENLEV